jgi:hypothetical protein
MNDQRRKHGLSSVCVGSDYDADQTEFLRAIDRFRSGKHRTPTYPEVLRIAKSLGYRKVAGQGKDGPGRRR